MPTSLLGCGLIAKSQAVVQTLRLLEARLLELPAVAQRSFRLRLHHHSAGRASSPMKRTIAAPSLSLSSRGMFSPAKSSVLVIGASHSLQRVSFIYLDTYDLTYNGTAVDECENNDAASIAPRGSKGPKAKISD